MDLSSRACFMRLMIYLMLVGGAINILKNHGKEPDISVYGI